MKQKMLLIGLIAIMSLDGQSQQVLTTAGGFYATSDAQLSWTLGELMTTTFTDSEVHLTQGEQQSLFIYASIDEENNFPNVAIYPNPFINAFTIESDGTPYEYAIHSATGQSILSGMIQSNQDLVDLTEIASGVYYIRIFTDEKEKTVKLIKH